MPKGIGLSISIDIFRDKITKKYRERNLFYTKKYFCNSFSKLSTKIVPFF